MCMNVEQRQAAADPQTKPPDLGAQSAYRLLLSTTIIAIYYLLNAPVEDLESYRQIFSVIGWTQTYRMMALYEKLKTSLTIRAFIRAQYLDRRTDRQKTT